MSKKLITKIAITGLLSLSIGIVSYYSLEWVFEKAFVDGMCGNSNMAEVKSPNGKLKAIVFERGCGATTGVSTHVSILLESADLPNEGGNICVVDVFPKVELRWIGDNELVIAHHGGARLFHAVQSFYGINIRYEVLGHTASNNSFNQPPR